MIKVTVIRPSKGWRTIDLAELLAYRDLLFFLVWRDLKVRYQQTVLGVSWAVIQPLITAGVFSIVFGRLARFPSDGMPYPLFCFTGLVIWTFFMQAVVNATSSVVLNQQLVSKVYFPRLIIPMATILAALVDLGAAIIVLLVVALSYGIPPGPKLLLLPPLLSITFALALGTGSFLAALNVRFRDVRHLTAFAVQLWLFMTPVVYPITAVPSGWRTLFAVNPMVGVVETFRWAVLGSGTLSWSLLTISACVSALVLVLGLLVFRRMESTFPDVI